MTTATATKTGGSSEPKFEKEVLDAIRSGYVSVSEILNYFSMISESNTSATLTKRDEINASLVSLCNKKVIKFDPWRKQYELL
jgi:hypothetical protein